MSVWTNLRSPTTRSYLLLESMCGRMGSPYASEALSVLRSRLLHPVGDAAFLLTTVLRCCATCASKADVRILRRALWVHRWSPEILLEVVCAFRQEDSIG